MKDTAAKLAALSAFFLHSTANPIARRYDLQTERAALDPTFNKDGLHPIAASRLSHAELRGSDGSFEPGREYGLRDSEFFYWGAAGSPRANMTAVTSDSNVKVLSLERFSDAVTDIVCSGNTIKLTLDEETKFDELQASWAWVNNADDNYIVFVTDECPELDGDGVGKQAWHVTAAAFDDATNVATLSATPVLWQDAFPRWHLHISSRSLLLDEQAGLAKRDEAQGSISLEYDFLGDSYPLSSEEGAPTIACTPCGTFGDLNYDFDIDRDGLEPTASVSLTPSGVGAQVTALLAIEKELTAEARLTQNIFMQGIDAIIIGPWVRIGPTINVDLTAGIDSATAKAELSAGLKMIIPDESLAVLSTSSDDQTVQGWAPSFESTLTDPRFETTVSVSASAALQIRFEFDLQVKVAGLTKGLAAGLVLDAPMLTFNAEAKNEDGACDNAEAKGGVDVNLEVGGSLGAFAGFGKPEDKPNEVEITSVGTPIYTTCMALTGAPPAATSSAVPTITSSAPPWGNFSGRSF